MINNIENLIKFLNLSKDDYNKLLGCASKGYLYTNFRLPKRNNGFRDIQAPIKSMKICQKKLLEYINTLYKGNACSYGFEKNKNHIQNANMHKKKKYILNIDLENMFNQITSKRIYGMLIKEPYKLNIDVARGISTLVCCKGFLPQGAPTSPIFANMVLKMLDTKLLLFAKAYKLYYTRYADDITFSSNIDFSKIVLKNYPFSLDINDSLLSIFEKANFHINKNKTKYFTYCRRQEVTGIIVNKKLNINKNLNKEIRAYLYFCDKYGAVNSAKKYFDKNNIKNKQDDGIVKEKFKKVLFGKINYLVNVKGVYDKVGIKYREKFNEIFSGGFKLEKIKNARSLIESCTFPIESNCSNGTCFVLKDIGIITAYHVIYDKKNNIHKDVYINYYNAKYKIESKDIIKSDGTNDYVVINKNVLNCHIQGLEYAKSYKLEEEIHFGGFPDNVVGNEILINDGKIICKSHKSVVGYISLINSNIFHGMSGCPIINSNLKVIGYGLIGIEMNDFYKNKVDNNKSGFKDISRIVEGMT